MTADLMTESPVYPDMKIVIVTPAFKAGYFRPVGTAPVKGDVSPPGNLSRAPGKDRTYRPASGTVGTKGA
jgi:hypothetical protein